MREGIHPCTTLPNEQKPLMIKGRQDSLTPPLKGESQPHESSTALNVYLNDYLRSLGCVRRRQGRWAV